MRLLDHDGVRQFLRNHDDEERLAGTNMFNIEKLEKALNDASYAKTLFQRWKTHGVNEAKVSGTFTKMKIVRDKNAQELLTDYRAWINLHSKSNDPALLFDRAKIDAAAADVKSTNDLFTK
ncbi:hypothetical protein PInf_022025 [Phytophthora infestans]|nr:hypothetical protein PInf_022025 [Phytophthora infestans]